jgi:hypothetical protein
MFNLHKFFIAKTVPNSGGPGIGKILFGKMSEMCYFCKS